MHDTVSKVKNDLLKASPRDGFAEVFSERLQEAGISRALAEPLSAHAQMLYQEAYNWLQHAEALPGASEGDRGRLFGELLFSSRHIRTVLANALPFLERAEDNLSEKEEITHRESGYEREVAPFSRLDATQPLRSFLAEHPSFSMALAGEAAQVEADLLKVMFMEDRIREGMPKPGDLYALVVELTLDARRHLVPVFEDGSDFMQALRKAGD